MRIRAAMNRDAERIREVVFGVLGEYGLVPDHQGVDADLDDLEANYIARGGLFAVVEDHKGAIIGSVGLFPKENGTCELRKMYLVREARGQGLGKQMLEYVLDAARERGFRRIELETSSKLIEAIGLYRRFGFRPVKAHVCQRCDQAFALDL